MRPDGEMRAGLDAMIDTFALGQSSSKLLRRALRESGTKLDLDEDVKPWLGKHAAVAVTRLHPRTRAHPDYVVLVETTDGARALASMTDAAGGKLPERRYHGTAYRLDAKEGQAAAIVDDTLAVATVKGLKSVIDTATSGNGLGAQGLYQRVVDTVDDDAIGFAYGDLGRVVQAARRSLRSMADRRQVDAADRAIEMRGLKTFAAGVVVAKGSLKLRLATTGKAHDLGSGGPAQLAALPASAWAGIGAGELGRAIGISLDQFRGLTGSGFDVGARLEAFRRKTDVDVEKDLLPWMGDTGLFVRGTSVTDIGGALVIQSKDPAATRAAMGKAKTVAVKAHMQPRILKTKGVDDGFSLRPKGLPVHVFVAIAGKRFVVAAGRSALRAALDPGTPLGDDEAFKTAAAQLGDGGRPTFFVDVPKIAGLVGFAASDHAAFAKAKPTLDKLKSVVGSTKRVGDVSVQTIAVGVR